jgi:hypothetical protein
MALVVYLWRRQKQCLQTIHALNSAVHSLSIDKAFLIAREQEKANLKWFDQANETIH